MGYVLGVDLGTTYTAAAVCEPGREPSMLSLGPAAYAVPSVLFVREDGSMLAGDAAVLRASSDPLRVARYFKRRLADEVPIHLAEQSFSSRQLVAAMLSWVIATATERQGEPPSKVVLTHPANWGDFRCELLSQAAATAEAGVVELLSEPEAAAIEYVASERIEPGELIGVYDLGGGTFDAVVMQRKEDGFEMVGRPAGVERLGGVDFDDAIRSFVMDSAGLGEVEQTPEVVAAAYSLLDRCVDAKRLLSADTSADVLVSFPMVSTTVRINRSEFEAQIRPRLLETLAAFQDALDSARVDAEDLSRILLVGGSSRIPLVSALLAQQFGRPLALDADPKNAVALGAARAGATALPGAVATPSDPATPIVPAPASVSASSTVREIRAPEPAGGAWKPAAEAPEESDQEVGEDLSGFDEPQPADELLSVAAESGHRVRIPQTPAVTPEPAPTSEPTSTEAVGVDPKVLVAVVGLLLLIGIVVVVLVPN